MNNTKRLASIDHILGGVPQFKCIEGCADCCGPVQMSRLELSRILSLTSKSANELQSEMMSALKESLHPSVVHAQAHGSCPLLDKQTHKCSVYDARPAICHLFGTVDHPRLECPHGRKPENLMPKEESERILHEVETLGHGHDLKYIRAAQTAFMKASMEVKV